jgi:DNA-binding NtrC family response regulator
MEGGTDVTNTVPAVLIVDDEQPVCDLLSEVLSECGYVCQSANSADEALAKLKDGDFDLALLDIRLPDISGLDLLTTMSEKYRSTKAVMTTAVDDTNTAVEAMRRGAVDYILKPFSPEEVTARIARALREKVLRGDGAEGAAKAHKHNAGSDLALMDFMSRGAETRIAQHDLHNRIVVEETVQLARQFRLPEREIGAWEIGRAHV